jgi:CheY-like chemotaxis protein
MMRSLDDITVLIVDDNRGTYLLIRDTLRAGHIHEVSAASLLEVKGLLEDVRVDAALVDLWLARSTSDIGSNSHTERVGTAVCRLIRQHHRNAFIALYSQDVDSLPKESWEKVRQEAQADDVKGVSWFQQHAHAEALREYIFSGIEQKNREIASERTLEWDSGLVTEGFRDVVSEPTVRLILDELLPGGAEDSIKVLTGGFSGSHVLRVNTKWRQKGSAASSTILKLDKQRHRIEAEVNGAPPIGSTEAFASAHAVKTTSHAVNGYWAFVAPAIDGPSLRTFLLSATPDPDIGSVVQSVIQDVVAPSLDHSAALEDDSGEDWTLLRPSFAAEIEHALREIKPAAKGFSWNVDASVDRIVAFLAPGVRTRWSATRAGGMVSYMHGDLHTENILVRKNGDVVCIDFARAYLLPRLFDVTTMFVNLVLVCGADEPSLWNVSTAKTQANQLLKVYPIGDLSWGAGTARLGRVGSLIAALGDSISQAEPLVSRAELRDAVLHQLLRFLRFNTVPMPRRILAVVLAEALLSQTQLVS